MTVALTETRMSHWTEGYHSGSEYIHGYHAELNPLRLHLAFLNAGLAAPTTSTACELGFGQGESMNLHAAASATQWFGTDFNPAHAAFAQEVAGASGAAATFFDQSFAEFCSRSDLPDFDFIGLHGIWSWISDKNRSVLVDFVGRKLKPGGVLYVCYNTLVGHAAFLPMQDLLTRHTDGMAPTGKGESERVGDALDFAEKMLAASPLYAQSQPQIAKQLSDIRAADRTYAAHEYINREWVPTSFARLADWLAPAKLDYACSARFFDMCDAWNLSAEQRALLSDIPDTTLRETVRDFFMNQRFRRDYWVKGARKLTLQEKIEGIRRQRVVLIRPRSLISVRATGALGAFTLNKAICDPILDALADYRPKTLGQIEHAVKDRGIGLAKIVEVVLTLMETANLSPVQEDSVIHAARKHTDRLNAFLCDKARYRATQSALASPVIGTGLIEVGRVVQFFVHGMSHGKKQPADLAAYAAQIFRGEGMTILEEERRYVSPEDGPSALAAEATFFVETLHPLLKALQIL
jgi:SAM-dependent methyltransferase